MQIQSVTPVIPVSNLGEAIRQLAPILGAPTFVDGDRWAQFDVAGRRIALAAGDQADSAPAIMLKVSDVKEAQQLALTQGLKTGEIRRGLHEERCSVLGPGGWPIIFYSPLQPLR